MALGLQQLILFQIALLSTIIQAELLRNRSNFLNFLSKNNKESENPYINKEALDQYNDVRENDISDGVSSEFDLETYKIRHKTLKDSLDGNTVKVLPQPEENEILYLTMSLEQNENQPKEQPLFERSDMSSDNELDYLGNIYLKENTDVSLDAKDTWQDINDTWDLDEFLLLKYDSDDSTALFQALDSPYNTSFVRGLNSTYFGRDENLFDSDERGRKHVKRPWSLERFLLGASQ